MAHNKRKVNLIYQTAFWGDLLLTIPLVRRVRTQHPEDELYLVCRKNFGKFFLDMGLVDQVFELDKSDGDERKQTFHALRAVEFQKIFCPHESIRSALTVFRLKAKEKIGFDHWYTRWAFTRTVSRPLHLPDALRQLSLAIEGDQDNTQDQTLADFYSKEVSQRSSARRKNLTSEVATNNNNQLQIPEYASMKISTSEDSRAYLHKKHHLANVVDGQKPYVAIAPGSQWPTKRWTLEGYRDLINRCLQDSVRVVLLGSPQDQEIAQTLLKDVAAIVSKERTNQTDRGLPVINLVGLTTPTDIYHLLRCAQALVSNDSGIMHMGSVAGTPTVAVFGPTTLDLGYEPWNNQAQVVETPLACRPCGKHGHVRCPLGTHECMKSIPSDAVYGKVRPWLS